MSTDLGLVLYMLFVTLMAIVLIFAFSRHQQKSNKKLPLKAGIGIVILGIAIYFFPFGAIDAYEATRTLLNLDYVQNSIFWYGICIGLGVLGFFLLKTGLRKVKK